MYKNSLLGSLEKYYKVLKKIHISATAWLNTVINLKWYNSSMAELVKKVNYNVLQ